MPENNQNLNQQQFHDGLAQFTEETLLPAMGQMMDVKIDPINQRLHSIELELEEIKIVIQRIDKRTDEDIQANYEEIDKLKQRVSDLENQVKMLKAQRA